MVRTYHFHAAEKLAANAISQLFETVDNGTHVAVLCSKDKEDNQACGKKGAGGRRCVKCSKRRARQRWGGGWHRENVP